MQKTLILFFIVVALIAYIETKKQYSEGKKEGKQENEEKRGQKENKYKQKEGEESKGREKKTKENVNKKDEQKQKYKGKQEKAKKDEKSEKATKDAEQKQQKKEKQEEPKTEKESCSKDGISCDKTSEPEAVAVCTTHGDCQPGSCCKSPGVCQKIDARESQKCWNSCMCGGGLLCFADGASKDATGICKVPSAEDLAAGGTYLQ